MSRAMLGLDSLPGRMPRALSGGQRQRVAMGRAMVGLVSVVVLMIIFQERVVSGLPAGGPKG